MLRMEEYSEQQDETGQPHVPSVDIVHHKKPLRRAEQRKRHRFRWKNPGAIASGID